MDFEPFYDTCSRYVLRLFIRKGLKYQYSLRLSAEAMLLIDSLRQRRRPSDELSFSPDRPSSPRQRCMLHVTGVR